MNYEDQLETLVNTLNEESSIYDFRINRGRKYDYIEKDVPNYGWQKTAAVVKDINSKVCNGYIRTRVGDIVELQGNTPKRGSKFVKGTIFTDDDNISDAFHSGRLTRFTPEWFRNQYKSRTPNSKR